MNPNLLRDQFETLEEPKGDALVVDVEGDPTTVVQRIRKQLQI